MPKKKRCGNKGTKPSIKTLAISPELHGWLKSLSQEYQLRSMAATVATLRKGWEMLTDADRHAAAGIGPEPQEPKEVDGVVLGKWLQNNL
jgi:hypothetical protein